MPNTGNTETFLSIGAFADNTCAENALKYIKTRFARTLLSVLKTTQDITPEKFKYVPLQDFTENSDIDWSKPVSEIDQQLYATGRNRLHRNSCKGDGLSGENQYSDNPTCRSNDIRLYNSRRFLS